MTDTYSFDRGSKTLVFLAPQVDGQPVTDFEVQITAAGHPAVEEDWTAPLVVPDEGVGVLIEGHQPGTTQWVRTRVTDNPEVEVTLAAIVRIT